ncbi:MAG: hypothetical protein RKP73_04190 [Candidatus Contendobacter sp.]|nr:hypothetical protein [Candidatus Contendobacter sp.]
MAATGRTDQRRTYILNGKIQTGKVEPVADIEIYRPVTYSSQTVTIRHARAWELESWLDFAAIQGEVMALS